MIFAAILRGIVGHVVKVTAVAAPEQRGLQIEGLTPVTEREVRVRVASALARIHDVDDRVRVTCDASGLGIDGCANDLAIALAACARSGTVDVAAIGELSLAGEVRPVRGVLAAVEAVSGRTKNVIVAPENVAEALLVEGARVFAARTLSDALSLVKAGLPDRSAEVATETRAATPAYADLVDVVGNDRARRAMEIAAVGGHNILLVGPPGTGKTMLPRRLAGILPALRKDEALEVTRIHSAAGLNVGGGLMTARPFRAPHHSTTPPGLVGGGASAARPGEMSLAHNGVLFLDELPELSRASMEALVEPLAAGEVVLCRASSTVRLPARCQIVASMSPCPCGHFGEPRCRCDEDTRRRYLARIPPRLLDLFDLHVKMERVDVRGERGAPESSALVGARVARARAWLSRVERAANPLISTLATAERTRRVARTIAAMAGASRVTPEHLEEAAHLSCSLGY